MAKTTVKSNNIQEPQEGQKPWWSRVGHRCGCNSIESQQENKDSKENKENKPWWSNLGHRCGCNSIESKK